MRKPSLLAAALLLLSSPFCLAQRIEVTIPAAKPLTGHLILVFAKKDRPEPRFQLSESYLSAQGFGVDVEDLKPGTPIVVDAKTFGNPRPSLDDLDAGDYYVQAVFNVYQPFHVESGKTLWLPPVSQSGVEQVLGARRIPGRVDPAAGWLR